MHDKTVTIRPSSVYRLFFLWTNAHIVPRESEIDWMTLLYRELFSSDFNDKSPENNQLSHHMLLLDKNYEY